MTSQERRQLRPGPVAAARPGKPAPTMRQYAERIQRVLDAPWTSSRRRRRGGRAGD